MSQIGNEWSYEATKEAIPGIECSDRTGMGALGKQRKDVSEQYIQEKRNQAELVIDQLVRKTKKKKFTPQV